MIRALLDPSPDALIAKRLTDRLGRDGARMAIAAVCRKFTNVELAALAARWAMWARPKQLPPPGFVSWGNLTARGWGKTMTCAQVITDEVMTGRVRVVTMAAQNMTKTEAVQVAGLIEAAPPWFKPRYDASREKLIWPNGAEAFAFTPEVPDAIRSPNAHLAWLSELGHWPNATREEAYSNFVFSTRVGGSRMIWDATPRKRHPILKRLLARAEAHPTKHFVVRGTIYENPHIDRVALDTMELDYGGTQKGREELLGEMLDEDEGGLVKQEVIDRHRAVPPKQFVRKAIGVDPAVTARSGSDSSGISLAALDLDDRLWVCADLTGKHEAAAWAKIVLDTYVSERCDTVVVETNKGGNLLTQNLRAAGKDRGLRIVVVDKDWRPHREAGVVFVREIFSRGEKSERATPLATAYERGRVWHDQGADLRELEDVLTSWVPEAGQRSPDRLDALVHVASELLGLLSNRPDLSAGFVGLTEMGAAVSGAAAPRTAVANIAALLSGSHAGGRI